MRKSQVTAVIVTFAIFAFGTCSYGKEKPAAPRPIVFRISTSQAPKETSMKHVWADKFIQLLQGRSGGRLKIEYYPSEQLFKDEDAIVALNQGTLDATVVSNGLLRSYVPKIDVYDLWGLILSLEQGRQFVNSNVVKRDILDPLKKKGMAGTLVCTRPLQIWTKKPINRLEDLKGLKMRTIPSKPLVAGAKSLGMSPITLPVSEMYTGLQQGTIDAVNTLDLTISSSSLYEVVNSCLEMPPTNMSGLVYLLSNSALEKMPKDLTAVIEKANSEAIQYTEDILNTKIAKAAQEHIRKNGMKFTRLNDDEKAKFHKACESSWADFKKEIGQELIDEALKFRK